MECKWIQFNVLLHNLWLLVERRVSTATAPFESPAPAKQQLTTFTTTSAAAAAAAVARASAAEPTLIAEPIVHADSARPAATPTPAQEPKPKEEPTPIEVATTSVLPPLPLHNPVCSYTATLVVSTTTGHPQTTLHRQQPFFCTTTQEQRIKLNLSCWYATYPISWA